MRKTPTILSLLCAFVLALCLYPLLAQAQEGDGTDAAGTAPTSVNAGNIASGTWGECSWEIDSAGTLTVHPGQAGATYSSALWHSYSLEIKAVVFAKEGSRKVIASEDSSYVFAGLTEATSFDLSGFDTSHATNMNSLFSGCRSLASLDLSGFDTSKVTDMGSMFNDCESLTSLNLSSFNTSKVTDMRGMFTLCRSLESLNLSGFDTSKVTSMYQMFTECRSLASIVGLSSFDTSMVTDMGCMFQTCLSLTSLDLSGFNTSQVTDMNQMFDCCQSLASLDISGFDTSKVTGMDSMFLLCIPLTTLDLSSFDTSKVTNMRQLVAGCSSLQTIYVGDLWTTSSLEDNYFEWTDEWYWGGGNMFNSCTSLVGGNGTAYDENHIDDAYARIDAPGTPGYLTRKGLPIIVASGTWGTCPWEIDSEGTLTVHPGEGAPPVREPFVAYTKGFWENWSDAIKAVVFVEEGGQKAIAPEDSAFLLRGLINAASIDLTGLDTSSVRNMSCFFSGCESVVSLDLSPLDTSNVTDMSYMFSDCKALSSLDLASFDTSNVETMCAMFAACTSLTSLDLTQFDTSRVTSMGWMFYSCTSLQSLDFSSFDTSDVTDMLYMFAACTSLTSLDLTQFDTSNVTRMDRMFKDSSALVTIYASDQWSTASLYEPSGTMNTELFIGCTSLVGEYGTKFSNSHTDATYARIDAPGTPGYLSRKVPAEELAGAGRYDTAAAIVEEAFGDTGSDYVIVASGENFPDALAASSLAGLLDCPVVLTSGKSLSAQAASTIQDLDADKAIIVGGTGAVSDTAANSVKSITGSKPVRLSGSDRYATMLQIYKHEGVETSEWGKTAIIATGGGYADTLSISGWAFANDAPIFLCDSSKGLAGATKTALADGGFERIVIVGGTGVVPASAESYAKELVGDENVKRLAGQDRYLTSKAIAEFALANGGSADKASIATGKNFPDALAGGALVGRNNSILLLADPGKTIALDVLSANKDDISTIYYLGGTGAVPQSVRRTAEAYAGMR